MEQEDMGDASGPRAHEQSPSVSALRVSPAIADLSDDEIDQFIDDPALIQTHDQALTVMAALDEEIANIQAQIDAAQVEANVRPLSADRQGWLRRAAYACAMRKQERKRIEQRDREIRKILFQPQRPKKEPGEGIARQARLKAEAEAKKAKNAAEGLKYSLAQQQLSEARRINNIFVVVAREMLPREQFSEILKESARRRTAQAIEARRAETSEAQAPSQDESATPPGGAPNLIGDAPEQGSGR